VSSTTDANNKTTTYTDGDPMWRLTSTTDPTNATSNIAYCNATAGGGPTCPGGSGNAVESTMNFQNGNSTNDVRTNFDGLGRPQVSQKQQNPGSSGYDSVETDYDALGRVLQVSLPYSATAVGSTAPSGTAFTTTSYDGMNRPLTITNAAGGYQQFTYSQRDVLKQVYPKPTNENIKQWQYEYDGLGQLLSVCEVASTLGSHGNCAQTAPQTGLYTTYGRDVLNHLTSVSQDAQASIPQSRSYNYDLLGRMTQEVNVESGTTNYVYDTDTTCGTSNGDPVKRTDAAVT
jgi:hypothetical protein